MVSMTQRYDTLPIIVRYLLLGLGIGNHIPGFVDAYYAPPQFATMAKDLNLTPQLLLEEAKSLLSAIDRGESLSYESGDLKVSGYETPHTGGEISSKRRAFLKAQTVGLLTTCRKLCGETIPYREEVELLYQVIPKKIDEDEILYAHEQLNAVLGGKGELKDRLTAWRERQIIPKAKLLDLVNQLSADFRDRTKSIFSLPEKESVEWILESDKPWSGFNYYLGNLKSKVAINIDLPVQTTSIAHLVAHETYPGHHSEHCKKELGLVEKYQFFEEAIFLIGTPQCVISEGLADLGLEVLLGEDFETHLAVHFKDLSIAYDPQEHSILRKAAGSMSGFRANAALMLHDEHLEPDFVQEEMSRMMLLSEQRAAKTLQFLSDPLWRTYVFCYEEGLPLCRGYVNGSRDRFLRLLSEQMLPKELA